MSKYRAMLIKFMESKNQILKDLTGIDLISPIDIAEIAEWPENKCGSILDDLSASGDAQCCPWCLVSACQACGYGIRNGYCYGTYMSAENPYVQISRKLRQILPPGIESISDIPEIIDLIKKTQAEFKREHLGNG